MPFDALTTFELPRLELASQVVPLQLNADIINRVLKTGAQDGVPRSQVGVPISPNGEINDTVLFEDPSDPSRRLYLPRYELALLAPDRYAVAFESRGTAGWALVVTLTPAPPLGVDVGDAGRLAHTTAVALSYQVPGGGMRELPFDAPVPVGDAPEAGLCAELPLRDMRQRDAVVRALRSQDATTQLVVRRAIEVAVLVSQPAVPPGDPGHHELTAAVRDHRSSLLRARLDDIGEMHPRAMRMREDMPEIDSGGGVVVPRPRPLPEPDPAPAEPSEPLFRRVPAVLDARVGEAFTFDKDVHPYVYASVVGAAPGQGRATKHGVPGHRYPYFQDPDLRNVFYYLHDEYRISRDGKTHKPVLSVGVVGTPGAAEPAKIVVDYVATGVTAPERLADAAAKLAPKVPKGFGELQLIPLEVRPEQLRYSVRIPRARVPTKTPAPEASLSLAAIQHSFETSVEDFQEIYSAMLGAVSSAFEGTLELTLDGDPQQYNFRILTRAEDFAGDLVQADEGATVTAGGAVDVALRNVVESPVRVTKAAAVIDDGAAAHPAVVTGVESPQQVAAGSALTVHVQAPEGIAGKVRVTAEATLEPDREAIWDAILEDASPAPYVRSIDVDGTGLFEGAGAAADIVEYVVEFEDHDDLVANQQLRLSAEQPTGTVALPMPIREAVLADPSSPGHGLEFRYRLRAVHRPPRDEPPTEWATGISPLHL